MSVFTATTQGRILCVLCLHAVPPDDLHTDFGADAWGRRYNAGICRVCATPPVNVMTADDELVTEVRGGA